jgi:sRNA-binding protein
MNQRRPFGLLAAVSAIILFGTFSQTFAQPGAGKPYGSRDPLACPDIKGNAPSAAMAKTSLQCNMERVVGINDAAKLTLVEEITVQIGKGRPYNPNTEVMDLSGIDTTVPVYPIRGSYKKYICEWAGERWGNVGKNCNLTDFPHAEGLCYKNEWGNWVCRMTDVMTNKTISTATAPPGGVQAANTPADTKTQKPQPAPAAQKPQPKDDTQPQDKPAKDENGYPIPDLSDLDKYFEISKVEYGDPAIDQHVHFLFKPKIDWRTRANSGLKFLVQYLDKDGALVASYVLALNPDTDLGEVGKASFSTPGETEMQKVASVKVVRIKN